MANPDKPDFSKRILDLAEQTQKAVGHTRLGGIVVRAFTGSNAPNYVQLDWQSRNIDSTIKKTVKVSGDLGAGRLARNWRSATILAINEQELRNTAGELGEPDNYQSAIAYIAEDVVHVGTNPNTRYGHPESVFARYTDDELMVGMRVGRATLEAAAGLWVPGERAFIGVEGIRVATSLMGIDKVHQAYPDILLA